MIVRRCRFGRLSIVGALGFLFVIISIVSCSVVRGSVAKENCSESLSDVYDRASPSVVFITTKFINRYQLSNRVERALGTGFIIDPSGLILTNSHVVFGRHQITVTLYDGTNLPAELVGADPIFDLAVIRIPKPSTGTLPTAALGDSDRVRVGQDVIAIGNPLGLNYTLTRGIVSAINRIIPVDPFSPPVPFIQTDAPINPGNSGGPLLDRRGEVIGINTAAIPSAENIGFSIPINLARAYLPSLIENGRIIRPWIGLNGQFIDAELQNLLKVPTVKGFLVEVVEPGSPAEKAGLRGGGFQLVVDEQEFLIGGDIITKMNGVDLDSLDRDRIVDIVKALKIGSPIKLTVFRDGEYKGIEYVLQERPVLLWDFPGYQSVAPYPSRKVR